MIFRRYVRGMAAVGALAIAACNSLDIENPNNPDNKKILSDPNAVEAVGAGALRVFANAWSTNRGAGPLTTMARTFSASWNNDHMRFYSSVDNPGDPNTTGYTPTASWYRQNEGYWANDAARPERIEIESFWDFSEDECCVGNTWPGVYAGLSSANDILRAIRTGGLEVRNPEDTKRLEIITQLGRGLALMTIALNYDKGYVIDEKLDATQPGAFDTLTYRTRKVMRDAAIASFQEVIDSATKYNDFATEAPWMNGRSYTANQIRRLASSLIAITYAYYPRDAAEATSEVNWGTVATYAANGMSAAGATPFDFMAVGDGCATWCPDHLVWFDEVGSGRVNTRVARLLDPATQTDPWPLAGNPQPNSLDKRLGNGTFGDGTLGGGSTTVKKDAGGGTDFAWAPRAIFRPARGAYHQSNIALIRYDETKVEGSDGIVTGRGPWPLFTATQSDLVWAEALLRRNAAGDAALAATLINKTRVTRGGLPPATIADGVGLVTDGPCMSTGVTSLNGSPCSLWAKLLYENEVELLGVGPAPYYVQRRLPFISTCGNTAPCPGRHVAGLLAGTPREMPVPVKELDIKGEAAYTWGGLGQPAKSAP